MQERRAEPRMLCADLIQVRWTDESGRQHEAVANLEDISLSGACLQLDTPIPEDTLLRLSHPKLDLVGRVRYCIYRDTGFFLGVKFEPGYAWSERRFRPKHMLDPRTLLKRGEPRRGPTGGNVQ
ncbi:MAG: PilZ domain-containing protein [Bryobacterales bacterium]|nr:PilZ domain-containing protein [Bryobacteraceae bacterium]MDW8129053.1 PilZ domain-containing protein [Bryobacterales bacterium]